MQVNEVLPGIADPAPGFLCQNLNDRSSSVRYRVPVAHTRIDCGNTDTAEFDQLPALPSVHQLRTLVGDGTGLGLFVSRQGSDCGGPETAEQAKMGSVLIFPPTEWPRLKSEFAEWQFEGVDAAFAGVPYSFDDILVFAQINFTPDCWYLVLRGPMAGNVCWWMHDPDSDTDSPWAIDVHDWGRRLWKELPDVFGGIIRFNAAASIDHPPADAQLYPERYLADLYSSSSR
jgi:hypothetical protein